MRKLERLRITMQNERVKSWKPFVVGQAVCLRRPKVWKLGPKGS